MQKKRAGQKATTNGTTGQRFSEFLVKVTEMAERQQKGTGLLAKLTDDEFKEAFMAVLIPLNPCHGKGEEDNQVSQREISMENSQMQFLITMFLGLIK